MDINSTIKELTWLKINLKNHLTVTERSDHHANMQYYQYIMIVFFILIMWRSPSNGALLILINYLLSIPLVNISADSYGYYYSVYCLLNLAAATALHGEFKIAALCSYLLVPVNVLGFYLWVHRYPPDLYNVICGIILIIQLLAMIPRELLHGRDGNNIQHTLNELGGFDSGQASNEVYKTSQNQKKRR